MKNQLMAYLAAAVLALAAITLVQNSASSTGSVRGTVTDPSGGIIPGATVTLTDSRGTTKATAADDYGEYRLTDLAPGHYVVVVKAKGFQNFEDRGLVIAAGQQSEADTPLTVNQPAQTVTVTASRNMTRGKAR